MKVRVMFIACSIAVLLALLPGDTAAQVGGLTRWTPPENAIYLPPGDAAKGRAAFLDLKCNTCHGVAGDGIARLVEGRLGPDMGKIQASLPASQLATSIIAPSHNVAAMNTKWRAGDVSRMGDFSYAMTVRQWIDLVAYMKSLKD